MGKTLSCLDIKKSSSNVTSTPFVLDNYSKKEICVATTIVG